MAAEDRTSGLYESGAGWRSVAMGSIVVAVSVFIVSVPVVSPCICTSILECA